MRKTSREVCSRVLASNPGLLKVHVRCDLLTLLRVCDEENR